jgi:hypothetical protein
MKDGYVYVADLSNPREPRIVHDRYSMGVVAALNLIHALGIKDRAVTRCASDALYLWQDAHNLRPIGLDEAETPIMAAMIGTERGQEWVMEIADFRHVCNNSRQLRAAVFEKHGPPPMPYELDAAFLPSSKITIELYPVLSALLLSIAKAQG